MVVECRQRGRAIAGDGVGSDEDGAPVEQLEHEDLSSLLGLREEEDAHLLLASSALLNRRRLLHGGVSLAASEVVATASRLRVECSLPTTSVHIVHTRGVEAGATVVFTVETRYSGRTLVVTDVVGSVAGTTCTVATVTAEDPRHGT